MQLCNSQRAGGARTGLAQGALGLLALVAVACVGCGRPTGTTVTGNVTWNQEPLAYGAISFVPVDGATKTAGAMITDGKYKAVDVPPGEKIVNVIAGAAPRAPGGSSDPPALPDFVIPPDAPGNGGHHTITAGQQTLDLSLMPAAGS